MIFQIFQLQRREQQVLKFCTLKLHGSLIRSTIFRNVQIRGFVNNCRRLNGFAIPLWRASTLNETTANVNYTLFLFVRCLISWNRAREYIPAGGVNARQPWNDVNVINITFRERRCIDEPAFQTTLVCTCASYRYSHVLTARTVRETPFGAVR